MGPITRREGTMGVLVLLALGLWIGGGRFIDPTTVALVAISLMVIFGVISWDDLLENKRAWNVLAWFATLVVLGDGLSKVGFTPWFGQHAAAWLGGFSPTVVMVALVAFFFLVHYIFASLTGHVVALMPVLLAAGAAVPGMPVRTFALLMAFSLGLMGVLTPYATGPSPVYYSCGFLSRREFWLLGLVFGMIFLAALLVIGVPTVR
jgi:L-tartrate/succinate antiporter